MHKSLLSIVLLIIWTAGASEHFTGQFNTSVSDLENAVRAKEFLSTNIKASVLDKSQAVQKANDIFNENPISHKHLLEIMIQKETDAEFIFQKGEIECRLSKHSNSEMLVDLGRYGKSQNEADIGKTAAISIANDYVSIYFKNVRAEELAEPKVVSLINSHCAIDSQGNVVGQEIKEKVSYHMVLFRRNLNGQQVLGPGGTIRVYVSPGGNVIGYSKIWREIEKSQTNPNSTPHKVVGPNSIKAALEKEDIPENKEFQNIMFGYFSHGRNKRQINMPLVYEVKSSYGDHSVVMLDYFDAITGKKISSLEKKVIRNSK